MTRRLLLIVAVAGLVSIPATPGYAAPAAIPTARAWAVRVEAPGAGELLVAADVAARAGERATGSPLLIAGQDPNRVTATLDEQDVSAPSPRIDDPTNSMTLDAGFAQAHVDEASSSASAGFASGSGSGFAMANELMTFEQQEQMLTSFQELNDAVIGPLNETLAALAPTLGVLGLTPPRVTGIAPSGLVDVVKASHVASTVGASLSPGFSSARASTTLGEVRLFGGFIEARGLGAEAVSESVDGADTRTATVRLGSLSIAGIAVEADRGGFRVAGHEVAGPGALQPAVDAVTSALAAAGVSIRTLSESGDGDARSAAALEIAYATASGPLLISVGYAHAAASSVAPIDRPAPPRPRASVAEPGVAPLPAPGAAVNDGGSSIAPVAAAPSVGAPRVGPRGRSYGTAAARALQALYVIVMTGAIVSALSAPARVTRRYRRLPRPEGVSS